jgi:hypothetical protein
MGARAKLPEIGRVDKFFVILVFLELSNLVAVRFMRAPKCRKND